MSLYAIGDTHLALGCDKPMDVFGGRWENYVEKLREGFSTLKPEDLTVLCGDLSWGMSLAQAREDFQFLHELPGHDYWWTTAPQAYRFFAENGIDTLDILNNNCWFYGDVALCGTRGWFYEEARGDEHDKKMLAREVLRLETSLKAAGEREKYVFLHYPPKLRPDGRLRRHALLLRTPARRRAGAGLRGGIPGHPLQSRQRRPAQLYPAAAAVTRRGK